MFVGWKVPACLSLGLQGWAFTVGRQDSCPDLALVFAVRIGEDTRHLFRFTGPRQWSDCVV